MKYLFLFFLSFFSFCIHAQEKIGGIGRFKIGMATTAVMTKLSSESRVQVKNSFKNPDNLQLMGLRNKKTANIYLLTKPPVPKDSVLKPSEWYIDHPGVKIYFVDYMEIAKVPVVRSYFYFFQDTLYKIYSKQVHKDFIEAVKLKYGEGSVYSNTTNFNCMDKGTNKRLSGDNSLINWVNNSIKTTYFYAEMFDTNCNPIYQTYFTVVDEKKEEQVNQALDEQRKKKQEEESNRRRKSLEDF